MINWFNHIGYDKERAGIGGNEGKKIFFSPFPETKPFFFYFLRFHYCSFLFFFFLFLQHYFGAAMKKMANEERDRDFCNGLLFRGVESSIRISAHVFV